MITEEQYKEASTKVKENEAIVNQYFKEQREAFAERVKKQESGEQYFTDEELLYSRYELCPCGHGLAYPKGCLGSHYWDCSAILKGIADKNVKHTGQLPFAFYNVKGERDGYTTRGIFKPKVG